MGGLISGNAEQEYDASDPDSDISDKLQVILSFSKAGAFSEDDMKKSFGFTGELQKLNESGASDCLSFIEQSETTFCTPARSTFGITLSRELSVTGFPIDVNAEPSLLPDTDSFAANTSVAELPELVAFWVRIPRMDN
ncbi:hypothetical protein BDN67DRAFT_1017038 [Paxillus ammoniavirescens]|nr:hypothetical protein BDN67DRAFT_1017038 [Paxillus ammoniavirescens]